MKSSTILLLIIVAIALFFLLSIGKDKREGYSIFDILTGFRRNTDVLAKQLGVSPPWWKNPSLNCYLKNQIGTPVTKVTTAYLGMDGAFTGIDVITGIELTNLEDEGPISIVSGTEISFNFDAEYGVINKIPFLPALGNLYFVRKGLEIAPSERKGLKATVYGFNLSPDIKQKISSQDWTYYFFNQSFSWGQYGGTTLGPNCQTIDQTGNIGCGDTC